MRDLEDGKYDPTLPSSHLHTSDLEDGELFDTDSLMALSLPGEKTPSSNWFPLDPNLNQEPAQEELFPDPAKVGDLENRPPPNQHQNKLVYSGPAASGMVRGSDHTLAPRNLESSLNIQGSSMPDKRKKQRKYKRKHKKGKKHRKRRRHSSSSSSSSSSSTSSSDSEEEVPQKKRKKDRESLDANKAVSTTLSFSRGAPPPPAPLPPNLPVRPVPSSDKAVNGEVNLKEILNKYKPEKRSKWDQTCAPASEETVEIIKNYWQEPVNKAMIRKVYDTLPRPENIPQLAKTKLNDLMTHFVAPETTAWDKQLGSILWSFQFAATPLTYMLDNLYKGSVPTTEQLVNYIHLSLQIMGRGAFGTNHLRRELLKINIDKNYLSLLEGNELNEDYSLLLGDRLPERIAELDKCIKISAKFNKFGKGQGNAKGPLPKKGGGPRQKNFHKVVHQNQDNRGPKQFNKKKYHKNNNNNNQKNHK